MITKTVNVVRYLVSGNSYPITYGYWDKEEIKVYLTQEDNSLVLLTLGTDYSLSSPNGTNGVLVKVSDWGTATKITILREVSLTQERDLVNGQTLNAETIEAALDHSMAAIQQLKEEQSRSLKTAVDEEGLEITFPNTEARKGTGSGTVICFDSSGSTIVLRDLKKFDQDIIDAANSALEAAQSALASEASYQRAHNEGISNIVSNETGDYVTVSIIQRDGTTTSYTVQRGKKGEKGETGATGRRVDRVPCPRVRQVLPERRDLRVLRDRRAIPERQEPPERAVSPHRLHHSSPLRLTRTETSMPIMRTRITRLISTTIPIQGICISTLNL